VVQFSVILKGAQQPSELISFRISHLIRSLLYSWRISPSEVLRIRKMQQVLS